MPTLDWIGKAAVVNHHRKVGYHLLRCDRELSAGDAEAGNLLVQGDNLLALKALLPFYAGKVKCIYIDPPFNTGSEEWIYNDNVNSPEIRQWLRQTVGKEGEDLSRHDKWLCMMYPRLALLREFLAQDGTVFISIDDNEIEHLIGLLDELFGRPNRLYIITFKQGSATGHKAINPGCVNTTNFIVMYAKKRSAWSPNRVFTGRERDARYGQFITNIDDDHEKWQIVTLAKAFATALNLPVKESRKLAKDEPERLEEFVLTNARSVIRTARPDYDGVSEVAREMIDGSKKHPKKVFHLAREDHSDMYFKNGERILFYVDKLKLVDGESVAGEPLTTLWDDILSNNLHKEGGVDFPKGKKPESLIKRVLELATSKGDLVLDSFAGSGTTGAVAHKLGRRWIMVELGDHCHTHIVPRISRVVDGTDQDGVSKIVSWKGGGGFRFCKLGQPLFDASGAITGDVKFSDLAAHVFFTETGNPIAARASGKTPLLGVHQGKAVYLLFNGVLGDKRPAGGNVLTHDVAQALPHHPGGAGPRVVYGEACRLGPKSLARYGIAFRQIPFELKVD